MAKCVVYKNSKQVSLKINGTLDYANMAIVTDEGDTYTINQLIRDFDGSDVTLNISSKDEEDLMITEE